MKKGIEARDEVEERLLELSIAEAAGGRRAPSLAVDDLRQRPVAPDARARRWAIAAAVLGCAVTLAVYALDRRKGPDAPGAPARSPSQAAAQEPTSQEPAPTQSIPREKEQDPVAEPRALPPEIESSDLRSVPRDAENLALSLRLYELDDLRVFYRLHRLRLELADAQALRVLGARDPLLPGVQRAARDACAAGQRILAVVAALPLLETLELPADLEVPASALRELQVALRLTSLTLVGKAGILDAETAEALTAMPHLRELRLLAFPVTAAGLRVLAKGPLTALELNFPPGCDDACIAALPGFTALRHLRLVGCGRAEIRLGGGPIPRIAAPTAAVLAGFGDRLVTLQLRDCALPPAALEAMPRSLVCLDLTNCDGFEAADLGRLAKLSGLRNLALGQAAVAYAVEEEQARWIAATTHVLGTLRLSTFAWTGRMGKDLAAALAAQPDLKRFAWTVRPPGTQDLEFLARMANVHEIELVDPKGLVADDLLHLARLRNLRGLRVVRPGDAFDSKAAQAGFGPQVTITAGESQAMPQTPMGSFVQVLTGRF